MNDSLTHYTRNQNSMIDWNNKHTIVSPFFSCIKTIHVCLVCANMCLCVCDVYVSVFVCVCIYIYIYIYIFFLFIYFFFLNKPTLECQIFFFLKRFKRIESLRWIESPRNAATKHLTSSCVWRQCVSWFMFTSHQFFRSQVRPYCARIQIH